MELGPLLGFLLKKNTCTVFNEKKIRVQCLMKKNIAQNNSVKS